MMTFVYPILLGGLALVGIPVLLHLIMRQQPKHLRFPAMRFLLQQHRTNQRKLRLRHLLLLALRMLLIGAFVLALARPKIFSERLFLATDRPVAAVLIFDTSPSMEYAVGGRTRLEDAKRRGLELLDELPARSSVAVLDTADPGGEWLVSISQARERINNLEIRPANYPVTAQLIPAYDLFAKRDEETEGAEETPPKFLYVFSDRTPGCWSGAQLEQIQRRRDLLPPNSIHAIFVDVGVDNPAAVAVTNLEMPKQIVFANEGVSLGATLQATGAGCDTEVLCRIDGQNQVDRKPVRLEAGQSRVLTFERKNLAPGFHQAEVFLATQGALPFANARYATFEVQGPRLVLTVADDAANARIWKLALEVLNFQCEVKTTEELRRNLFPKDLEKYKAVCLLGVAKPDKDCWDKLKVYVRGGGGLAVIPGGNEIDIAAYNTPEAQELLPARLVQVENAKGRGAVWNAATYQHPVMSQFAEWSKEGNVDFFQPGSEPAAKLFWEVKPAPNQEAYVIVSYDEQKPALVERNFDRQKMRGRAILFTTPLDDRHIEAKTDTRWNTYLERSFYLVLARQTLGYLAGGGGEGTFNYQSGQTVPVAVPTSPRYLTYVVQGPGLSNAEGVVPRDEDQSELRVSKAVAPGNFKVFGSEGPAIAGFSVNVNPEESQLGRLPVEQVETLFGPGTVLPVDHKTTFHDAMQNHWNQPVELLPWLMLLVLLVLVVENLLGNKFYRREPEARMESS